MEPEFSKFQAVYCAGFFVHDPALVTAMCLLFEKVHLPSHFQYLPLVDTPLDFEFEDWVTHSWTSYTYNTRDENGSDLLASMSETEQARVSLYLKQAAQFYIQYMPLFGPILESDLFTHSTVSWGGWGHPNEQLPLDRKTSYYKPRLTLQGKGADKRLLQVLQHGASPVLGLDQVQAGLGSVVPQSALTSSLLALSATDLALPHARPASAEDILEARSKLKDQLPPFWAEMLRLSVDFNSWVKGGMSYGELDLAAKDYINSRVRPRLIDVNQKLIKEHKNWASKIISPFGDGVKLGLGLEKLTWAQLLLIGLQTLGRVIDNFSPHDLEPSDTGLTFLIKLDKVMRTRV